jgi:uncharacterized membrane protein YdjX (TVP38/TMEM64 family)
MNQDVPQPTSHRSPLTTHQNWRLWIGSVLIAIAVVSLALSWFGVDWDEVLAAAQERRQEWQGWVDDDIWLAAGLYFAIYVVFTGLSLPGAVILTLIGGAFFGLWLGVVLVSFASTLGATLAFLSSRLLLGDWVQRRYGARLEAIHREMATSGGYYLLALRLNPVIPFFLINLLFGLTRISAARFWWISQLGMLPATFVYTNAGVQLAGVTSLRGIMSWPVLLSLIALGLFPLAARKIAQWLRKR